MLFALICGISVSMASSKVDKLITHLENGNSKSFKSEIIQMSDVDLKRVLEKALAESNPEFLRIVVGTQKRSLNVFKDNPDLLTIAISESGAVDNLKTIDKILPLNSVKLAEGKNLLQIAADAGSVKQVEFISKLYPKLVNDLDLNSESAVTIAARRGNLDILQAVLKIPFVKLDFKNKNGKTAIEIAKDEGFLETASAIEKATRNQKK